MADIAPIHTTLHASLGAGQLAGAQQASATASVRAAREASRKYAAAAKDSSSSQDEVDVSELAFYMGKSRNLPVRQELVDRVKAEIAQGNYDTPEKLSAALDEMISDWY